MSIDAIRKRYGLTCTVGQRVRYTPPGAPAREGKILSSDGKWIRIQLDPLPGRDGKPRWFHPTWCLEFLDQEAIR